MAETHNVRSPTWLAFLAGAVTMLVIVLLVLAWNATRTALTATLRANLGLDRYALSLPRNPPPEGPHLPKPPVPAPR